MSLAVELAQRTGTYVGTGDGIESGPFRARVDVCPLPGGSVSIDYTATAPDGSHLHAEHTILSPGADGRDRLYIAHDESPVTTELIETGPGSGRFEQPAAGGPYTLAVVAEVPEPARLTYAWWWAVAGETPIEQSRADVRLEETP